jgi:DNA sulfur modification protein DndC
MMNVLGQGNLTGDLLKERCEEIRDVYQGDDRPWVIGYSGGKDSTTALQLIWYALSAMPREALRKPVYIISSDTLVETPKIVEYLHGSLQRMNQAAAVQGLPFSAHKVSPVIDDTFWVNLLGKGYPAPSKRFRWCTDRMKIQPANRFILDTVAKHGEVVVVLGVRSEESATRAQVMSLHRIKGSPLSRHSFLPHAYVYTPIKEFTVNDVWMYLLQAPNPWGNDNRALVTMYRNAQAGECPLVVDKTTPSCGNSRFGCWVCTVVDRDKSMEAMVDSGEDWLQSLLSFRDELAKTQDPAVKAQVREFKRRDGRVKEKKDGDGIVRGPYKLSVRKGFLRMLLVTQERVRREGPNKEEQLITPAELHEIRRIWRTEEGDWEDSLPTIYREVTGQDLSWVVDEQPGFSARDKALLDELCRRRSVPTGMVAKLLDVEREVHGMSRRSAVYQRIASTFDEDWRTEEEVLRPYGGVTQ